MRSNKIGILSGMRNSHKNEKKISVPKLIIKDTSDVICASLPDVGSKLDCEIEQDWNSFWDEE